MLCSFNLQGELPLSSLGSTINTTIFHRVSLTPLTTSEPPYPPHLAICLLLIFLLNISYLRKVQVDFIIDYHVFQGSLELFFTRFKPSPSPQGSGSAWRGRSLPGWSVWRRASLLTKRDSGLVTTSSSSATTMWSSSRRTPCWRSSSKGL